MPKGNRGMPSRAPFDGTGRNGLGDVPDYKADAPPDGFGSFIMLPEGVAKLYAADFVEGPFPEHYEPVESPVENASSSQRRGQSPGQDLQQRYRQTRDCRGISRTSARPIA